MLHKSLAAAGIAFACVSSGLFVAAGVVVWKVRAEVDRQTVYVVAQAHTAGKAADDAVEFVGKVIGQAQTDLNDTRKHVADPEPARVNPIVRMSARQASVNLAGSVERALGAIVAA